MMLLTIYISDSTWLNQQLGKRAVRAQRSLKCFGFQGDIVLEMKRLIISSKSNSAWVVLVLDVFFFVFVFLYQLSFGKKMICRIFIKIRSACCQ